MPLKKSLEKKEKLNSSVTTIDSVKKSSKKDSQESQSGETLGSLLPTPRSRDWKGQSKNRKHNTVDGIVSLLPTPSASPWDGRGETQKKHWDKKKQRMLKEGKQPFSTPLHIKIQEQSSQEASHVSHSVKRAKGGEQVITDIYGQKCLSASGSSNPPGLLQRMFTDLLVGQGEWFSSKCTLTWKKKVTKSGVTLFQLVPKTLPTEEIESGLLLPTPNTMEGLKPKSKENLMEKHEKHRPGRSYVTCNLRERIAYGMIPTANAWDGRRGPGKEYNPKSKSQKDRTLETLVQKGGTPTGLKLQPSFVEWMMGFPQGWTDLNCPNQNIGKKD